VSVALGVDKGVEENEFGNREEGPGEHQVCPSKFQQYGVNTWLRRRLYRWL